MKSPKRLLFGLILCLLLAVKVQSRIACFQTPTELCDNEETTLPYSLPNPLVNTTLTVFSQNPTFMNDVTEVSNQIAQQIVTAIQESSGSSSIGSIVNSFTGGLLDGLDLANDGQTITDLTNLFTTFASIIGQETEAEATQTAIDDFVANFEGYINILNTFPGKSPNTIDQDLTYLNNQFILLHANFANNSLLFNNYTYYTFQPLYVTAMLHVNILSMLALAEQAIGQNDSESYLSNAATMQQSYSTLLQSYASLTGPYRASFITEVNCDEQESMDCGESCSFSYSFTYSFQDNFLPANEIVVLQKTEDWEIGACTGNGAAAQAAQSSYLQAVESGTTAYFDQYVTSFLNYNPNPGSASLLFV